MDIVGIAECCQKGWTQIIKGRIGWCQNRQGGTAGPPQKPFESGTGNEFGKNRIRVLAI